MENNFKYIVYQTVNTVNNKIYIGVHKTNTPDKFDGYIGCGVKIYLPSTYMNPKTPFQYAVKKYGTSSFIRTVIYIFDNMTDAYNKEREIVNLDFIKRDDTYNSIIGGMYHYDVKIIREYRKIYLFDLKGNLIKEWNDIYEVSDFLDTWKQSVYQAINNKNRLYNYYWSYKSLINIKEFSNPNESRKVYLYSKKGKCLYIYNSIGEAAKLNNTTSSHILTNIQNGALTDGLYYFSFELYDEYVLKPRLDLKDKILYLYDLNGNYIEDINIKDFKKKYDIHTYKTISNVILNKQSLKGFLIRLDRSDSIEPYIPKNKKRAVLIYTKNGDFVEELESISYACKKYNLDSSTVSKILRGCGKSTKGYTIKYKN